MIMHLKIQLLQSFDKNSSILGIIKDISKAFDTANLRNVPIF